MDETSSATGGVQGESQPAESIRQPAESTRQTRTMDKKKSQASTSANIAISVSISEGNLTSNTSTTANTRGLGNGAAYVETPAPTTSGLTGPGIVNASTNAQSGSKGRK